MHGNANPIFLLPVFVALAIFVTIKLGGVMLPGGRTITKASNPRGYWLFLALSFVALAIVSALALFEALPASVVHGH